MGYLDAHGRSALKAAPKLLERLAEMELEAREENVMTTMMTTMKIGRIMAPPHGPSPKDQLERDAC